MLLIITFNFNWKSVCVRIIGTSVMVGSYQRQQIISSHSQRKINFLSTFKWFDFCSQYNVKTWQRLLSALCWVCFSGVISLFQCLAFANLQLCYCYFEKKFHNRKQFVLSNSYVFNENRHFIVIANDIFWIKITYYVSLLKAMVSFNVPYQFELYYILLAILLHLFNIMEIIFKAASNVIFVK